MKQSATRLGDRCLALAQRLLVVCQAVLELAAVRYPESPKTPLPCSSLLSSPPNFAVVVLAWADLGVAVEQD